jgi:hypothetical protein
MFCDQGTQGMVTAPWVTEWAQHHDVEMLGSLGSFSVMRFWQTIKGALLLRQAVKSRRIDLIHVMFAEPNALWAIFRHFLDVPIVVTTRGTDVLQTIPKFFDAKDPLSFVVSRLYTLAFRQADAVTSTSSAQVTSLGRLIPNLGPKSHVIRTGLDLATLRKACPAPASEGQGKPFVLFPRLMKPIYQHEFALAAIALLPQSTLDKYRFLFVDSESSSWEYVETIKAAMAISPGDIGFLPMLAPNVLLDHLARASLVVMTPGSDGSSVTAAESLYLRKPLILPPLDYDKELFGRGAFFFDRWEPQSLADKIVEVLSGSWESQLEMGFQDICSHFDRDKEMARLRDLYRQLLGIGKAPPPGPTILAGD